MPLVIALPHRRAVSRCPSRPSLSSRRTVNRRAQSLSSRATSRTSRSSRTSTTTAPSSVSISPSRNAKGEADITIRLKRGITVNNYTGAEHSYSEDEDSGVRVGLTGSLEEEYSTDEEEDEEEYSDDEDDEWDVIDPSDSASRPHVKHPTVQAATAPPPRHKVAAPRAESRHAVPVVDPPSRPRSRSRTALAREHRGTRRRRPQSTHQDSLDAEDDYPGYPPAGAPQPPHHPSPGWGHIPQQQGHNGYVASMMSDPRYHQFSGAQSPAGQLVAQGFHGDPGYYGQGHGFNPSEPNPFAQGPPRGDQGSYFGQQYPPQHGRGGRANRNSMGGPPPEGAMMPYGQPPMGYYPPYGSPYGMPPGMMPHMGMYPPHAYAPQPPASPPHPPSKKHTPKPREEEEYEPRPPPPQHTNSAPPQHIMQYIPPPLPPPPVNTEKEDGMLTKLEKLLLGKAEEDEKAAEAARKAQENAKFDRLEQILITQQEAKAAKEKQKAAAAEEARKNAADAKKKGDEDKLATLEKLILAQKDEQLKREAAQEAARAAEKKDQDEKAAKYAAEKKAAAEKAKDLLDAAKAAREDAEKKAAEEAKKTKEAHEKAIEEAKKAAEELEKAKKAAEDEAAKLKPSDAPKPPIKFKDAVGRKFSFPWHICKTWKVHLLSPSPHPHNTLLTQPRAWKNSSNKPSSTST